MDRSKELFKIMFLLYLLGKDTIHPINGNDYIRQAMRAMQNNDEIGDANNMQYREDMDEFLQMMGNSNPEEMLNNFLNRVCNFEEILRENQQFNNEMALTTNIYVCCIMYMMGVPFPYNGDGTGPTVDEICSMVQKEAPMVESDADALLNQLNLTFVVFDNDDQDAHYTNEQDMAPRVMVLIKEAMVAERNTGTNGVVTLKVKVVPKAMESYHINVTIPSTEAFVATKVAFNGGVPIQK